MAKAKNILAQPVTTNELKIELIGVVDESANSRKRTEEVEELVVKIILLGRKRGRPSTKVEEFENAA